MKRKTNKIIMLSNKDTKSFAATRLKGMTVLVLFLIMAVTAPLQVIYAVQDNDRSLSALAQQIVADRSDEVMAISMDIKDMPLHEALEILTEEIGVGLSYSSDIALDKKVTLRMSDVPFHEVLYALLEGTNLEPVLPPTRDVLVIREKEEDAEIYQETVRGTVVDAETGEALPGVNILIEGTSTGTITDVDGQFELGVPDLQQTLVFSYIGYATQQIEIDGSDEINISLSTTAIFGDEVVVIGYGNMARQDLTGSISSVQSEAISNVMATRPDQALLGKMAGVQVKPVDGTPGAAPQIVIRGIGSMSAGTEPLYVVDGFPVDDLGTLNPNDIQSIDILKDASSTAIYGSRGSNGVVIVTTKRGQTGDVQLNLDVSVGSQEVSQVPHYMNAREQAEYAYWGSYFRSLDLSGEHPTGPPESWVYSPPQMALDIINGEPGTPDVDWIDQVLRDAPTSKYHLTAFGGSEDIRYGISGEYLNQDGIIIGSGFDRYSLRANIDAQLTERLAVKLNLNPSFTESVGEDPQGTGYGTSILGNAASISPYTPVYDENGDYFVVDGLPEVGNFPNPVALANEVTDRTNSTRFTGNIDAAYSILDELVFNLMVGANYSSSKRLRFVPNIPSLLNTSAYGYDAANLRVNWISEFTLNYDKNFGEHDISGLAGFTNEKSKTEFNDIESDNYPNNLIPYLSAVGGILTGGGAGISEWTLLSYLARINYNYGGRYYLTTSLRRDGSSRFGSENKYAFFPSVALAWRISNEGFLNDVDFISNLKLRVSYGQSGNNRIGNYASLATIDNINYPLGNSPAGGYVQNRIPNPFLTWEKQESFNTGLDIGIFDDRLNLTFDYFRNLNHDLLLDVNIPAITGFNNALQNIGEVENKGWEIGANTVNVQGNFRWTTDFNFSMYENKVLALGPEDDPIINPRHITMVGEPIGMFYGFVQDGIFETQAEYEEGPYYNPGGSNMTRLGDIKFKDFSGPNGEPDGVIDSYDRVIIGNPYPDFFYGMTNNFNYRNFSLSVSIQGVYGNSVASHWRDVGGRNEFRVNQLAVYNDFWKSEEEPGNGIAQRPNDEPTGGIREFSTQKLDDGSYLRINNISFGYEVPTNITQGLNISSLRVYLNVNNAYTFTDFEGFNPDVSRTNNPLLPGEDNNNYPLARTWTVGLNLGF